MNHAEATLAILNYQPADHFPVVHFGYWIETLQKWVKEGHLPAGPDGQFGNEDDIFNEAAN